jgi:hypothetical protein
MGEIRYTYRTSIINYEYKIQHVKSIRREEHNIKTDVK